MSFLQSLLETEESRNFLYENQDLILEAAEDVENFSVLLKEFVVQNADYFMENSLDLTYKNIKIFSELATAQYLSEIVALCERTISMNEQKQENYDPLGDYL